jgi:hypothetical protein
MQLDLIDLRLFLQVAEAGSITHGARRAHLALAGASTRIRNLEAATPFCTSSVITSQARLVVPFATRFSEPVDMRVVRLMVKNAAQHVLSGSARSSF